MSDTLQKFMFEHAGVRGEFVELQASWQQIQEHQQYPAPVRNLLGEMMAAAALLSANLKFNGSMILQVHGDGPVKLLVVECDSQLRLRGTAKLREDAPIADDATLHDLVHSGGNGRCVITLDPADKVPGQQAYQGIVPLDGDDIATILENYMLRSEQLDTKLWLAADHQVARGLLLQKLPRHGGTQAQVEDEQQAWNHAAMLGDTLRREEMLEHDIQTLMHRLFWEETLRVFDPLHPSFHCTCSREKVGNMLKMLGAQEVEAALADMGSIEVKCDFCGQKQQFDAVDCAQLFLPAAAPEAAATDAATRH